MEEMELLVPRAKKDVWARRRDVRVMDVGERSMRAAWLDKVVWEGVGRDLLRKKNCRRKRR